MKNSLASLFFIFVSSFSHAAGLDAETVKTIHSYLPQVDNGEIQKILKSPDTIWDDESSMPQTYQDAVNNGARLRVPGEPSTLVLRHLDQNRGSFQFPFDTTAGVNKNPKVTTWKFLSLPKKDGKKLPVVYFVRDRQSYFGNTSVVDWTFPVGTVIGEVITERAPDGQRDVKEIRIGVRKPHDWERKIFRPFPTAGSLVVAIEKLMEKEPELNNNSEVRKLLEHARDVSTIRAQSVRDGFGLVELDGASDELPPMSLKLTRKLLSVKPFESATLSAWKKNGKLTSFAPTSSSYSFTLTNNTLGALPTRNASCHQCHSNGQRPWEHFVDSSVLYGENWGNSEGVFYWHPFDPRIISGGGNPQDPRNLRKVFIDEGILEPWDGSRHDRAIYTTIKRAWK